MVAAFVSKPLRSCTDSASLAVALSQIKGMPRYTSSVTATTDAEPLCSSPGDSHAFRPSAHC